MKKLLSVSTLMPVLLASWGVSAEETNTSPSSIQEPSASLSQPLHDPENDRMFPIWGPEARARGYELPKAYGFSLSYMNMDQPLHIKSIDLSGQALGGALGEDLDDLSDISGPLFDDFLDISDADQTADNVTLRADMWVLPFLNFYGLIGYTEGDSEAPITCRSDRPGFSLRPDSPADNILAGILNDKDLCGAAGNGESRRVGTFKLDYEGFTYGVGMTLAGGVGNWFTIMDLNFSRTELDILSGQIDSLVFSPRVGYRFNPGGHELRVWVGGMYQGVQQEMAGNLSDILSGPIGNAVHEISPDGRFKVKQELDSEWNTTLGANYVINRSWGIITEVGFGDRDSYFAALEYRY